MQGAHLRKYGVAATIPFELYEVDGVDFRVDAVHATGDSTRVKDGGAEQNTANGFVDEGKGYSITLSTSEMQAAEIVVYIVDQTATKVWLDKAIIIETYGHAAAMHAMDFDDAVRGGMTALPDAASNAPGGLPISDAGGLDLDAIKVVTDKLVFTVANQVDANLKSLDDSVTAAGNLSKASLGIGAGTVNTDVVASTTTTFQSNDIVEADANHFIGRIITFYRSSDGLFLQATDIVDYELNGAEGKFTVTALTEAPGDGNVFVIT